MKPEDVATLFPWQVRLLRDRSHQFEVVTFLRVKIKIKSEIIQKVYWLPKQINSNHMHNIRHQCFSKYFLSRRCIDIFGYFDQRFPF